jgi:hypothetical protein
MNNSISVNLMENIFYIFIYDERDFLRVK